MLKLEDVHLMVAPKTNFNYEGETKGLFCLKHKSEGMVDVKTRRCSFNGCSQKPISIMKEKPKVYFVTTQKRRYGRC